jgi:AcrR family transcriptional regulator
MAKTTRAEQSERTKNKLIRATRDLVVKGGWSGASSRAIARRAGVNLALINFHFGGKVKLFEATLDQCVANVASTYGPWGEARGLSELIEMCARAAPEISSDSNARFVFAAMLESPRDSDLRAAVRRQLDLFREGISKVVKKSGLASADTGPASILIAGAIDGLMIHLVLDPSTGAAGALEFLGVALGSLVADQSS